MNHYSHAVSWYILKTKIFMNVKQEVSRFVVVVGQSHSLVYFDEVHARNLSMK